ncbi:MAG: fused MFS/spermidine synthase [Leptospiraceae bacterium]|nr:fused MFS/spermidine synthase [Leptospiraceae bacterium]
MSVKQKRIGWPEPTGLALGLVLAMGLGALALHSGNLKAGPPHPWTQKDPNQITPMTLQELRSLPAGDLENFQSTFSHIVVRKIDSRLGLYFKKGGFLYKETEIDLSNPARLVLAYGRLAPAALLYSSNRDRFLLLGLGGGAVSNYFHRYLPDMTIDGVEIDAGVAAMAVRYFLTEPGAKYHIHVADARSFVQSTNRKYDLVMGDAYGGGYIPEHLITVEFYKEIKSILRPGGALFLNLYDEEVYQRSLVTLHLVFDHTHTYFSPSNASRIVVAFDGQEPDEQELRRRASELQKRYGFYHSLPEMLRYRRSAQPDPEFQPYRDGSTL